MNDEIEETEQLDEIDETDDQLLDPPAVSPNVDWTVYDTGTGMVLRTGNASPEDAMLQAGGPDEAVIPARVDGNSHYLPSGVVTLRPTLAFDTLTIAADGVNSATLHLPGPFVAVIDGVSHELEDILEIASDMPATYRIEITHFPYRAFATEITAEAVAP